MRHSIRRRDAAPIAAALLLACNANRLLPTVTMANRQQSSVRQARALRQQLFRL